MKRILIFSGTTEGRQLADILDASGICADVCVATEYGHEVMTEGQYRNIYTGRLTEEEMKEKVYNLLTDQEVYSAYKDKIKILQKTMMTLNTYLKSVKDIYEESES